MPMLQSDCGYTSDEMTDEDEGKKTGKTAVAVGR